MAKLKDTAGSIFNRTHYTEQQMIEIQFTDMMTCDHWIDNPLVQIFPDDDMGYRMEYGLTGAPLSLNDQANLMCLEECLLASVEEMQRLKYPVIIDVAKRTIYTPYLQNLVGLLTIMPSDPNQERIFTLDQLLAARDPRQKLMLQ